MLKLSDSNGSVLKGSFRENEIKVVPKKGMLIVTDILQKIKQNNQIYYIVTIQTFGTSKYFKFTDGELGKFKFTHNAKHAKDFLK